MTTNHSESPILRRIFATTHQRDSVRSTTSTRSTRSTSNTTVSSFHSRNSTITRVESRISQWIVVNETPGGASNDPEIIEGSQIEDSEIEGAEDIRHIAANDGDIPTNDDVDIPTNDDSDNSPRRYQFYNCHLYIDCYNTRGVKVKNSGNYAPRVTRVSSLEILMQLSMTDPYC